MVAHWVLGPLGTGRHRLCAAGAPGLALWVPHPLRALTLSRNSSGALLAHWESDLPADPHVGSIGLLDGHCNPPPRTWNADQQANMEANLNNHTLYLANLLI